MVREEKLKYKSIGLFVVFLFAMLLLLVGCKKDYQIQVNYIIDNQTYSEEFYNNKIELPKTPEKIGADFDGWYIDKNYTIKYDGKNLEKQNKVNLYGRFIYTKFVLDYYVFDNFYDSEAFDTIEDVQFAEPPHFDGYKFAGWFFNNAPIDAETLKGYMKDFGSYKIYAQYFCLHNELSDEFMVGVTCTQDGMWCNKCLNCEQVFELRIAEKLGHSRSDYTSYDSQKHWVSCVRCSYKFDPSLHTMSNADNCKQCNYYILDKPMSGSALTSIAKREDISPDFQNIAGNYNGKVQMTAVNIGQGDCIFIKFPDGKTMIMDSGSTLQLGGNNYDRLEAVLKANNVAQIDYLFITHSDYDHIRYAEDILNDYQVKNIYLPKVADDITNTYEDFIKAVSKEKYTDRGQTKLAQVRFNIGDFQIAGVGWRMRCYTYLSKDYPLVTKSTATSPTAPNASDAKIKNSLSPVCLLEYAGRTIVLTGDSNEYNEKYLLERNVFDQLDADILKVAHHGSKTSTTDEFLASVKCEYAIISYGTNTYGHPTSEVLERLQAYNYKNVFKTKEDGNIYVNISGDGEITFDTGNEAKSFDKQLNMYNQQCLIYTCPDLFVSKVKFEKENYV